MKKKIRVGVFESNSSSTHSLSIVTEDVFNKWKNGELLFNRYSEDFVEAKNYPTFTEEDVEDFYNENKEKYWKNWDQLSHYEKQEWVGKYKDEVLDDEDEDYMTYNRYMDYYCYEYETYERHFTSPSNDKMIAFGYYGYDN